MLSKSPSLPRTTMSPSNSSTSYTSASSGLSASGHFVGDASWYGQLKLCCWACRAAAVIICALRALTVDASFAIILQTCSLKLTRQVYGCSWYQCFRQLFRTCCRGGLTSLAKMHCPSLKILKPQSPKFVTCMPCQQVDASVRHECSRGPTAAYSTSVWHVSRKAACAANTGWRAHTSSMLGGCSTAITAVLEPSTPAQ